MKTLLLTKKLFVITVFSFFVYGCQLSTKNLTPETFYLMCGEKLIIQIKWIGSVPNEVGALSIHALGEDFNYNNVLFLKSTSGAI